MSPRRFKPFKNSKKSPFDHDGPNQKAVKEALDWMATHDANTPSPTLIQKAQKPLQPPPQNDPDYLPERRPAQPTPCDEKVSAPPKEQSQPDGHEKASDLPAEPAAPSVETAPPESKPEQTEAAVKPESAVPASAPEPAKQHKTEREEEVSGVADPVCLPAVPVRRGGAGRTPASASEAGSGEFQEQTKETAATPPSVTKPRDKGESSSDYNEEAEQIASQIRSLLRGPQRPPVNSRRLRRIDDDDPANISRHRRLCIICRHDDKYAIEQAFLEWRTPHEIKREFHLSDYRCIYRHARATALFEKRARNLRAGLEKVIEESTIRPPSADSIIRAVRVYGCLDANGRWVEPPRNLIITHQTIRQSEPAVLPNGTEVVLKTCQSVATKPLQEDGPAAPGSKKLINVAPTVLDLERGA